MAIVGTRKRAKGNGYNKNEFSALARDYTDVTKAIMQENGLDIFSEGARVSLNESAKDSLENFYVENSADTENMSPEEQKEHEEMMRESFLNDMEALREYAPIGAANPVMGLVFPLHKNLLMTNIWDKGILAKDVAVQPKFTLSMETRMLVDVDGNEIDLFREQYKIKEAMDAVSPYVDVTLTLPEVGTTDILADMGATPKDNLSIKTHISSVQLTSDDTWHDTKISTSPIYGDADRAVIQAVTITQVDDSDPLNPVTTVTEDTITFTMKNNVVTVSALKGNIKAVVLKAKKDTSNGLVNTPTPKWSLRTEMIEIPEANPINTTIAPEEIKDIQALYNVDQLAKYMGIIKDVMANYKDDTIKAQLDESFGLLPDTDKDAIKFDFKPPTGYASDFVSWRQDTFMDVVDTFATGLLNVLNDPNMTITFVGRPDVIRKVTPTQYQYKSPASIGPVELDFQRTVVTSDKRVYQFVSSQKITNDSIMVILKPRNSNRIVYKLYDYQMFVSNDIRNAGNHTLPAVHAFERWLLKEYQPVQGRIEVLNPDGGFVQR